MFRTPCQTGYHLENGICVPDSSQPPNQQCGPGYYPDNNGNCVKYYEGCPIGYEPNAYGQCVPVGNQFNISSGGLLIVVGLGIILLLFLVFQHIKVGR